MGIQTFTRRSPTRVSNSGSNNTIVAATNANSNKETTTPMKWGGRSDFSRPSISSSSSNSTSSTMVIEQPPVEEEKISQPRFSVFGNRHKFTTIKPIIQEEETVQMNIPRLKQSPPHHIKNPIGSSITALVQEQQQQQQEDTTTTKRIAPKFELHLSTKSAANHKEEEEEKLMMKQPQDITQISPTKTQRKSEVKFHPVFLEQVALFRESQPANQVSEAHNKSPYFRIICPSTCWYPIETNDYHEKNIIVTKKSIFVTKDNTQIKGKLMIRNLALDKSVSIRYTYDSWTSVRDVDGIFFGPNPKNIAFDIYEFAMSLDEVTDHGELRGKIEFAIRVTAGDDDYWDNNNGKNYQIKIIADPLNDPWKVEKEEQQAAAASIDGERQEEEEEKYEDEELEEEELEEEQEEKHNSFTNALKGYKHAKPFHLNKRQPWLGTRYDFGQSLQLAKRAPYESWSTTVKADPTLITDYFLVKPISIKPTLPPPPPSPPAPIQQQPTPSSSLTTTKPSPSSLTVSFSNFPKISCPKPSPTATTITTTTTTTRTSTAPIKVTPPLSYSRSFSVVVPPPPPSSKKSSSTTTISTTVINSAPPSPCTSPKLNSAAGHHHPTPVRPTLHHSYTSPANSLSTAATVTSPLDMNSSYYLDLVNKYCFYNGSTSSTRQYDDTLLPIS